MSASRTIPQWIEQLRSADDALRGPAWQEAGPVGAAGVPAAVALFSDPDPETARAAKRAIWNIVHHAGRPGAASERRGVEAELGKCLAGAPLATAREIVWLLSAGGGRESVPLLAPLLRQPELREDARCALQRLPGARATRALREALRTADPGFAPCWRHALRARGEVVDAPPSRKLVPSQSTSVV